QGLITEVIPSENKEDGPQEPPEDVICHKSPIGHATDAGNKRRKGTDNGDEACEHNRLPAVALVELMRAVKMLPLEKTVLAVKGPRADEVANAVVHRIAKYCCEPQEHKEPTYRQIPPGAEGSCSKQERIARQERCDDNAGFQKDDHKEDDVHPHPI